ncbi:MAG: hypothetical protein IPG91_02150 [Ideonella sp.]|nr:hypothetical protein [Ideonella sp.]
MEPFDVPSDDEAYAFLSRGLKHMLRRTDVDMRPGERARLYAWYWGYYGRAALDLYQATGQARFVSLVQETAQRLLAERDDATGRVDESRGEVAPSWGTRFGKVRSTEITTAGLIVLPMCQCALLTGDASLARPAFETLAFYVPEQRQLEDGSLYFVHRTTARVEALNHANVYATALAYASRLPGAPADFAPTALGVGRYFRRFARDDGAAACWPYEPTPSSPPDLPGEALWKASVSLELPVALHASGLEDASALLARIANIIKLNPLARAGKIPRFIGSARDIELSSKDEGTSMAGALGAWLLIDDLELHEIVLSLMAQHPAMFPCGWYGGSRCMILGQARRRLLASRRAPQL